MAVQDENTPPLRSSQPMVDIPGFFDLCQKALDLYLKVADPPDQTKPLLVHEFPKERLMKEDDKFDVITYKVASGTMAPTMNDGSTPRTPKLRETKPHPKLTNYNVEIYGHTELIQAEFIIWSKSSRNAHLIAEWFHAFMMRTAYVLKLFLSRGVQNFRFIGRKDDDVDQSFGQELYKNRLTYEFRIERLFAGEQRQLTDLDLNYGVNGPTDSINLKPTQ
jgi:hypothetical protein